MEINFQNTIIGNHIILRKIDVNDAADVFKWRSGPSGRYMRQPVNYSLKSQEDWIKSRTEKEINYIILDKKTMEKVGTIGIYNLNEEDKISSVGRLLLNEVFFEKSNPYGLEALLLCYDFVLNKLEFRKITGDILGTNLPMFKLQSFLGMIKEGYLKDHIIINDKFEDLYIMSIFRKQFNDTYKNKINFLLKSF